MSSVAGLTSVRLIQRPTTPKHKLLRSKLLLLLRALHRPPPTASVTQKLTTLRYISNKYLIRIVTDFK
jgi:hypothetical protein